MSDARRYALWPDGPIQGQGHEPFNVGNAATIISYNGSWQLTTIRTIDHIVSNSFIKPTLGLQNSL